MFEPYLVRLRRHFSSDRLLNIFRPIRIGPGALLAPMPSPRTWSNFPTEPKAPCVILSLCPYNSPSKFQVFPSYLRRKGGILTLMGLLIVNPWLTRVEVLPHVPHYCYWRFITHEALLIAPGGFMSLASNGGVPNQRLIFPQFFGRE